MSSRTRAKKKAEATPEQMSNESSTPQQTAQLDPRITHITDQLGTIQEQHAAFEAEMRQAMLEMKSEQSQLRERYTKLLARQKEARDAHQQLQLDHVAQKSTISVLERNFDRLLAVIRSAEVPATHVENVVEQQRAEHEQHVDVISDAGSDVSFAAESRVSDLSDLRSEASAASRSTGYAHSSFEAARSALERHRRGYGGA